MNRGIEEEPGVKFEEGESNGDPEIIHSWPIFSGLRNIGDMYIAGCCINGTNIMKMDNTSPSPSLALVP